jgi:hypothetical protein
VIGDRRTMMRRLLAQRRSREARRLELVAAVVVSLLVAASALGDVLPHGSIRAVPARTGSASHLVVSASFDQPTTAELRAYNVDFARGFAFDPRAAAGRCTVTEARRAACPASSNIGGGTGQLSVGAHTPLTVAIGFYIMRPQRAGDVAGIVLAAGEPKSGVTFALIGRLVRLTRGPYGLELRFADTAAELPAGLRVQLQRVHVNFGAQRTVTLLRHRTRNPTYHLLTNPSSCPRRGWPVLLTVSYSTGTEHYLGMAACVRSR